MIFLLKKTIIFCFFSKLFTAVNKNNLTIIKSKDLQKERNEEEFLFLQDMVFVINDKNSKTFVKENIMKYDKSLLNKSWNDENIISIFEEFVGSFVEFLNNLLTKNSQNFEIPQLKFTNNIKEELKFQFLNSKEPEKKLPFYKLAPKISDKIFEEQIYGLFSFFSSKIILIKLLNELNINSWAQIYKIVSLESKKLTFRLDFFNLINVVKKEELINYYPHYNFQVVESEKEKHLKLNHVRQELEWVKYNENSRSYDNADVSMEIAKYKYKSFKEVYDGEKNKIKGLKREFPYFYPEYIVKPCYFINIDLNQIFIHCIYEISIKTDDFDINLIWKKLYELYIVSCEKDLINNILKIASKNTGSNIFINYIYNYKTISYKLTTYHQLRKENNFIRNIVKKNLNVEFHKMVELLYNNFIISLKINLERRFDLEVYKENYVNGTTLKIIYNGENKTGKKIKIEDYLTADKAKETDYKKVDLNLQ